MLHPDFLRLPVAHRALHAPGCARPENSRAAVAAAVSAGYGIEIDLQLSADGVAMVFHDDTLERLTDAQGPLRAHTAAALARLTLKDGAEGIPTLQEVLSIVGGRVPLLIEVKDQSGTVGPVDGQLEQATAAALAGYSGPVAVMSFNPESVAQMARHAPQVPRGLTTWGWPISDLPPSARTPEALSRLSHLREIADYARLGACFISHHHRDLDRPRVAQLKSAGAAILCWTIQSLEMESRARRVADNVTFEGYLPALPKAP
jgi:glycerophosphoryl diester phosphodiesterase